MPPSFEHFALNVPDARAMARWYMRHLGMKKVFALSSPPYTHFLADAGGRVVIEIYSNPHASSLSFPNLEAAAFHWAFAVEDPKSVAKKLEGVGAEVIQETYPEEGTVILTLRDPWGIPLQLCRRHHPLATGEAEVPQVDAATADKSDKRKAEKRRKDSKEKRSRRCATIA